MEFDSHCPQSFLEALPFDCLLRVFDFLPADDVCRLSRVSRLLHEVCEEEETVWKRQSQFYFFDTNADVDFDGRTRKIENLLGAPFKDVMRLVFKSKENPEDNLVKSRSAFVKKLSDCRSYWPMMILMFGQDEAEMRMIAGWGNSQNTWVSVEIPHADRGVNGRSAYGSAETSVIRRLIEKMEFRRRWGDVIVLIPPGHKGDLSHVDIMFDSFRWLRIDLVNILARRFENGIILGVSGACHWACRVSQRRVVKIRLSEISLRTAAPVPGLDLRKQISKMRLLPETGTELSNPADLLLQAYQKLGSSGSESQVWLVGIEDAMLERHILLHIPHVQILHQSTFAIAWEYLHLKSEWFGLFDSLALNQ